MVVLLAIVALEPPSHARAISWAAALLVFLPVLIAVASWVVRPLRRQWRNDEPICGRCGYSRIGLSGFVCPECGGDCRVVGTGRLVRQGRWGALGPIVACVAWVLIVIAAHSLYRLEISLYMYRLLFGYDEFSMSGRGTAERDLAQRASGLVLPTLIGLGLGMIMGLSIWRWWRWRRLARGPAALSDGAR
jgi:hypothetical protein